VVNTVLNLDTNRCDGDTVHADKGWARPQVATSPADKMNAIIQYPLVSCARQSLFSTMSRRKESVRREFVLAQRNDGSTNRPTPSTSVNAGPSHSTFDRAEAIAAKQLKIVCI
jgi:hypothetical protein